jgi:hypothetical protein
MLVPLGTGLIASPEKSIVSEKGSTTSFFLNGTQFASK